MLARPGHLWQLLYALREEIPEAALAITPAGSEGNIIEHMQMNDVLKIPLHHGGMYFGNSIHTSLCFVFPSCACGCSLKRNIQPPPIFSPSFSSFPLHSLHPTPLMGFDNKQLQAQECEVKSVAWSLEVLYQTPHWYDSNNMGGKAIKTTFCFTFPYFWSLWKMTAIVAAGSIKLPPAD